MSIAAKFDRLDRHQPHAAEVVEGMIDRYCEKLDPIARAQRLVKELITLTSPYDDDGKAGA